MQQPMARQRGLLGIAALTLTLVLLPLAGAHAEDSLRLPLPKALQTGPLDGDGFSASYFKFLPAHQMPDGGWSAMDWDRWFLRRPRSPDPRLPGRAQSPHDVAVSGLALAAFLGAGYTHRGRHPFAGVVRRGADALRRRQAPDGSFTRPGDPDPRGGHAIATLALTELYGMTGSLLYKRALVSGLRHLLSTRGRNGVWQRPGSEEDDALATFWGALALKSAELVLKDHKRRGAEAPFALDPSLALRRIVTWLDMRTDKETGMVRPRNDGERERGATTPVLTAGGALLRTYTGAQAKTSARLRGALAYLAAHPPSSTAGRSETDTLYAYFGTLATFQAGGEPWNVWKKAIAASIIDTQDRSDAASMLRGSWAPQGAWARARGRVASTTLASLLLQVFYRYDKVFGDSGGTRRTGRARIEALSAERTWKQSALPIHAARMSLAGGGSLPIDALHVQADVRGMRAQVVLDLFVTNTQSRQRQGVLDLRLPRGATPYYLAFGEAELATIPLPGAPGRRGTDLASLRARDHGEWGRVREARIAPVVRATRAFETIVNRGKDPALLTWSGAGVFHLRVFPLLGGKQHRIVVAYEVDLVPIGETAELKLPLSSGLRSVHVAVRAPGAVWEATPAVPIAEGVRTWHDPEADAITVRVQRAGDCWLVGRAGDTHEYTAAWVRPDVPRLPRAGASHALFLIDVSRSVAAAQMQVWQDLVPAILTANRDQLATFSVHFFDMRTRRWREAQAQNTPPNVAALRETLRNLDPGGATDLAGALASSREAPRGTDVFLFTDGDRSWGATSQAAVLRRVPKPNPIYAYATGLGREDRAMLTAITEQSKGAVFSVQGPSEVSDAARAHRHHPWQIDSLRVAGLDDLLVAGDPVRIYPGQRLHLAGRGRPSPGAHLLVALRRGPRRHLLRSPVPAPADSPMAARAYGRAGVQRLEEAGARHEKLAQDYAANFRVVRKSSALLMLESEEDYERFGLTETAAAERVAATPIRAALGSGSSAPRPAAPTPLSVLLAYARRRELPEPLVARLRRASPETLVLPADPHPSADEPVLRALGGRFESGDVTAHRSLALQALAAGMPRHAYEILLRSPTASYVCDWIMARAAARARRPLLAILSYEAALGAEPRAHDTEVSWVIAADYERYLGHFLRGDERRHATRFARARLESLAKWREQSGGYLPPRQAALVVLHMPFHREDGATIELHGPAGIAKVDPAGNEPEPDFAHLPSRPRCRALQLTALRTLAPGPWHLRLRRPPQERPTSDTQRSLVVVIRDWGSASERIVFLRSVGATDDLRYRLDDG